MQKILTIKFLQKQKSRREDCIQATGFFNKERNFDGESALCTEEIVFPHLLYILYHIFRHTQIFAGFFQQNKSPGFLQGKMHFQAISGQIFQFFTNHFFRILIIFCFRIKIDNFSGFRNLSDYLAFLVIISCFPGIHEPAIFLLIKKIAPDFSPLALPSGSLVQEFPDFLNHLMNFSSLSFLVFFVFFFALLVHVCKV